MELNKLYSQYFGQSHEVALQKVWEDGVANGRLMEAHDVFLDVSDTVEAGLVAQAEHQIELIEHPEDHLDEEAQ